MLTWHARAEAFNRGEGPNPGRPPPMILPKPLLAPKDLPLAWRASLAWIALSVIALGLVLCLILASPLPDVATWLAAMGELLALACLIVGLALLVHVTTRALTGGVGYWAAVKRVAQRHPES